MAKHQIAGNQGGGERKRNRQSRAKSKATEAVSLRDLQRGLADRGIQRSISTLQKWTKHPAWQFGKPSKANPVDIDKVAAWSGKLPPDPKRAPSEKPPEQPADGSPPLRADENPDPYAPPSDAQLIELRHRNPDAWAEVLRKMEVGRQTRIDNEIKLGKYVLASEAEEKRMRLINNVRSALMRYPKHRRQQLADATDPDEIERLLTDDLRWLCNNAFGQRDDNSEANGSGSTTT